MPLSNTLFFGFRKIDIVKFTVFKKKNYIFVENPIYAEYKAN